MTALPAAARTLPPPPCPEAIHGCRCQAQAAVQPLPHVLARARVPEAAGTGEEPCWGCHEPAVFGHRPACARGGYRQNAPPPGNFPWLWRES